jgi:hypothetical protein
MEGGKETISHRVGPVRVTAGPPHPRILDIAAIFLRRERVVP